MAAALARVSVLRYCHLNRGQTHCRSQASLVPPEPGPEFFPGNNPNLNGDFDGPFPLAVGNELLLFDHRCCNQVPLPGGGVGSDVNFLYTSEDGGSTITGPGTIGKQAPTGTVLVYGGNDPQIGVISDSQTFGTFFQGTPAGAFASTTANLGNLGPDEAHDGRLALDGSRPVAAFDDLTITSSSASTAAAATSTIPATGRYPRWPDSSRGSSADPAGGGSRIDRRSGRRGGRAGSSPECCAGPRSRSPQPARTPAPSRSTRTPEAD